VTRNSKFKGVRTAMNSTLAREGLLERLIRTQGIVVRQSEREEPFWYTSGRPGPFYVQTENIAGNPASGEILRRITETLAAEKTGDDKLQQIWHLVMNAVGRDPEYKKSIDLLTDYLLASGVEKPDVISGGERRDWFFSIPLAAALGVPHAFLLKSGGVWHSNEFGEPVFNTLAGKRVLHVADIINLGSSYTRHWLPTLNRLEAAITHTLSVAVRGQEGVRNLAEAGVDVITPVIVDAGLFEELYRLGLIPNFAREEIGQYFASSQAWTEELLRQSGATE